MWRRNKVAAVMSVTAAVALVCLGVYRRRKKRWYRQGFLGLVGSTPMIELRSLSEATGCTILAKVEFLNPGGSVKDRVAKFILERSDADNIYEGTSGSTGISLTLGCHQLGKRCHIFMPDDQATEKEKTLRSLGAHVKLERPQSIIDPKHICKGAERAAREGGGLFTDQFENTANFFAHYHGTGKEIMEQTGGEIDGFVAAAGTGGTIAGIACRLKKTLGCRLKVCLADPQGSSLLSSVKNGVLFNPRDKEGYRERHPYDTVVEGVGLNRLTKNFQIALPLIDDAFFVSDSEAVEMAYHLLYNDGLFVGSSAALNCCAVVKFARTLPPNSTIVTILCDSGFRHLSKFWNPTHLAELAILPDFVEPDGQVDRTKMRAPSEFVR